MTDLLDTLPAKSQNIDVPFDAPFFFGTSGASGLVPGLYQVALDGRAYVIDPSKYQRTTVPLQRPSTDDSVEPGEQSLSSLGAWRRSQHNWFEGAGQRYLDNPFAYVSLYTHSGENPSVRTRFWRSKGLDPWTEGELSLLDEYTKLADCTDDPIVCLVGSTLYLWDGATLYESTDPGADDPTFTAIDSPSGTSWPAVSSLATDGAHLYAACGDYGIAKVTPGSTDSTILRPDPGTPSASAKGTTGSTSYSYYLVGVDANGYKTMPSDEVTVADGPATLSTTDYNEITWDAVDGIVTWDLLRSGTDKAIATGLTQTSYSDNGSSSLADYTAPTATTENFQPDALVYGNGFLVGGDGPLLAQVGANGATSEVTTHFNADWTWDCGCGSPVAIYVAGHAGGVSEVYGIQLSTQTFGLGAPYIAAQVTDGEVVNAMCYYQGIVVLATTLGVRTCEDTQSNGYLTSGPVIADLGGSKCVAPYGAYVWFGVSDFDEDDGIYDGTETSSGLGRLSLGEFSAPLTPAFALDVQAPDGTDADCTSVAVIDGTPYFTIDGSGLYGPSGDKVAKGWMETGWTRYGTTADKFLVSTALRHESLPAGASIQLKIVPFGGRSFSTAKSGQTGSIGPPAPVSAGNRVGEAFQVIPVLMRATDTTKGPVLKRWTCRAMVVSPRQFEIDVPIRWADEVLTPTGAGTAVHMDLERERDFLEQLQAAGTPFLYQEGDRSFTAYIDQMQLAGSKWNGDKTEVEGVMTVKLITVA